MDFQICGHISAANVSDKSAGCDDSTERLIYVWGEVERSVIVDATDYSSAGVSASVCIRATGGHLNIAVTQISQNV